MLGVLQENLLVLLSFDKDRAQTIRNCIDVGLFGGQYKLIAARIYDFIDKYKRPPGDHLADLMADKLESQNQREATLYEDILTSIDDAKGGINTEYVMASLEAFVRRQNLRSVAVDLAKELQRDTEQSLEAAERLIASATTKSLGLFDPGTRLGDPTRALAFLDLSNTAFPTGIDELDMRGFGPTRKELWLFISNTKGGKTWMLIHMARMAAQHRHRVLHVTLEMSEARTTQRYYQGFFAISKRKETFKRTRFKLDNLGRIAGLEDDTMQPALTLDDPQIRRKLLHRIGKTKDRLLDNIWVKQFPTGSLTIPQLKGYMDNLEATQQFTPDLLVLDYPDLMKLDSANYRLSLDQLYKEVRGIAVERNIAVAAVSQSHREAARAKVVGAYNVAEAYAKIFHADTVITLSQTEAEEQLSLARLNVAAGRNDKDGLTLVISQNYGTGQAVVDAVQMRGNYFGLLPKLDGDENETT